MDTHTANPFCGLIYPNSAEDKKMFSETTTCLDEEEKIDSKHENVVDLKKTWRKP